MSDAALDLDAIDAVVFDLDGVLTDTASLHEEAWTAVFRRLFAERTGSGAPAAFGPEDYRRLVDGESREDGVRNVLASRELAYPEGSPDDPPGAPTVQGIAAEKDDRYLELLRSRGPRPFASSAPFLERLHQDGVSVAVVSGSRHCAEVLEAAGLDHLVDARVDGVVASLMDLPGKPDPALFTEAACRLGVSPGRAAVIEDAASGVEAARRGGFLVAVGVDRGRGSAALLTSHGADMVVSDLAEVTLEGCGPATRPSLLCFTDPDPAAEGVVETLCTLANGYIGTRGARPWATDDGTSYPGSYVAGLYNRLSAEIGGQEVEFESLVNVPNWMSVDLAFDGGPLMSEGAFVIFDHRIRLDMRRGVLWRSCVAQDPAGRQTRMVERRLVSMASPHHLALTLTVVPENWSGSLDVVARLDGNVTVDETIEDRILPHHHLEVVDQSCDEHGGLSLRVRTLQSQVMVAMAGRCAMSGSTGGAEWGDDSRPGAPAIRCRHTVSAGERLTLDKVVSVATSRDRAISEPGGAAGELAGDHKEMADLEPSHSRRWRQLWDRSAMAADFADGAERAMTTHMFHLLQVASPHLPDLDAGLGPRGLHGEGYRGHIFWDTLFLFPVLNYRFPAVARAALGYRVRRLPAARRAAVAHGHRGAMFPWQSGSDGRDETPRLLYNPRSKRWMPDRSGNQRHVGLAIAYEAWEHWQVSGDLSFMAGPGVELMAEVARFFADLATWDEDLGRYRIGGVMGPDEFHDGYPWSAEPGVIDNAYTNVMAAWLLWRMQDLVDLLVGEGHPEAIERLGLEQAELDHWDAVSRRLHVPFHEGVVSQFAGYERLEPLDLEALGARYGDIGRLDLILEAEGDAVNRYQVGKQADVLMLFYLLSAEELRSVLARMGYTLEPETIRRTVDYYAGRVTHGSTLSRIVHSWVLSRADRQASWRYFERALGVDIADPGTGTTREGIHLGATAGVIDLLQRCYTGLEARGETLWLNPVMPPELRGLSMALTFRDRLISIEVDQRRLRLAMVGDRVAPLNVMVRDEPIVLYPRRPTEVALA